MGSVHDGGVSAVGVDGDGVGVGEVGAAGENRDRVQASEHGEVRCAHSGGQFLGHPGCFGVLIRMASVSWGQHLALMDKGFGRDAADVDAGAAVHVGGLLDHRDTPAAAAKRRSKGFSGFSISDDGEVDVEGVVLQRRHDRCSFPGGTRCWPLPVAGPGRGRPPRARRGGGL
ncbi:hypothetical protein A5743_08535 [Mycolicibacterium conceptionense]|nr:hypothetical protein A5743_08535 [Mycolicibacterium conceptionense]